MVPAESRTKYVVVTDGETLIEFPLPTTAAVQFPVLHRHAAVFCNSGIIVSVTDCPAQIVVADALIPSVRSTVLVVMLVATGGLKSKTISDLFKTVVPCARFCLLLILNEINPWLFGSSVVESGRRILLK